MKRYSITIHYDSVPELKDSLIQLHGSLTPSMDELVHNIELARQPNPILQDLPYKEVSASEAHIQQPRAELPQFDGRAGSTPTRDMLVKREIGADKNVETDSEGIPWDERIHSGGKTKSVSNGKWTKRKRLPSGEYETVYAELLAAKKAPVQTNAVQVPPLNIVSPASESVQVPPLNTEPALINVNTPMGLVGLTPQEHEYFKQGASVAQLLQSRQPVVEVQIPQMNISAPQAQPVPMYDFGTFQKTLPTVLSELFNKGIATAQTLQGLSQEMGGVELWTVMQDQNKCGQLYNLMSQRGLIQAVQY